MVLQKKNTSEKKDTNWFLFAMGLSHQLFSDYVSLKVLFHTEALAFAETNMVSMVEVAEKSFKLFLAVQEKLDDPLSHYSSEYGHNLEKLRKRAADFNPVFDEEDIKQFTKPFEDKRGVFYQYLRYGSEKTTEGFKTKLGSLMPIIDKIFFSSVLRFDDQDKRVVNGVSLLNFLITDNPFHQSNNRDFLIQAVKTNNPYFSEYADYSWELENEQKQAMESMMQTVRSSSES